MEEKENSNPPPFFYSRLHAEKNGPPSCDQHEDDSVEKKRSNLIDMVDKHLAIENSQHCQKKKTKFSITHTHTHRRPFRSWLDFSFLVVWTFLYAVVFSYRECVCVCCASQMLPNVFLFFFLSSCTSPCFRLLFSVDHIPSLYFITCSSFFLFMPRAHHEIATDPTQNCIFTGALGEESGHGLICDLFLFFLFFLI